MQQRILAGAMSGTSADGVDVALVEIGGRGQNMNATLLHHYHRPYESGLRRAIFELRDTLSCRLADVAKLGRDITLAYAGALEQALAQANIPATQIEAIAAHGQTLFHAPPLTVQWLDPSLLSALSGCTVVSDFRRADCAVGGQGAPLVPFADYLLFRDPDRDRILLNLGGIANLTYLRRGGTIDELIAFDTGPANCISDWICRTHEPAGLGYDREGAAALRGRVVREIVDRTMADPYLAAPAPKSTDGPAMIAAFERAAAGKFHAMEDLLATAAHITAATIVRAVATLHLPENAACQIVASGGGTQNRAIWRELREQFDPRIAIDRTDDLGVASDAKEAIAFALLGAATLDGEPSNVPSVTGARRRVVLGSITRTGNAES